MAIKALYLDQRVLVNGQSTLQKYDNSLNLKEYVEDILADGAEAQTAALTDITFTAPGTPDYVIQDLVNSNAYGFVTKDEGNTVLSVIKNLQDRVSELEARLEALGIVS